MPGFHARLGAVVHLMVRACTRVGCLFSAAAIALLSPHALAQTWSFETIVNDATTRGWTADIARGAGGRVYAGAYAGPQCAIYSRDPVSGVWSPEVSPEFNRSYYDLAVDQTGRPFVLASNGAMSIIRRNDNGTWTAIPVGATNHAEGETLTFDSQNRPVVSWVDITTRTAGYATYNGSTWTSTPLLTDASLRFGNRSIALALDSQDRPHVLWYNYDDNHLRHTGPDSTGTMMTQDLSGLPYTTGFSMLFDSAGRLNAAFVINLGNAAADGVYHGVYDGVGWQSVRTGAAAYRAPALVLDGVGNPSIVCVTYSGLMDSVTMATRSAGVWSTQPVTSWSSTINGPETAEAAYFDGAIHMVYCDAQIGFHHGIYSTPTTPPTVAITSPSPFASMCGNMTVTGTASAAGGFSRYVLEYATNPNGPWANIATSTTPVTNGTLATWNTSTLSTGRYFLRLTAETTGGLRESVVTAFGLDRTNPTAQFTISDNITVFGGDVCVTGIVRDLSAPFNDATRFTLFARNVTTGGPEFTLFSSSPGPYSGLLHTWRSRTGVPDADYQLRLLPTDGCGSGNAPTRTVIIDNTPPQASIDTPASCGRVAGAVQVVGSVQDAHLSGWTLEYIGGPRTSWTVITRGVQNASGVLGTWQTADLPPCVYALRLTATDRALIDCVASPLALAGNRTEVVRLVKIGCPADMDDGTSTGTPDGGVTLDDLLYFLERLDAGC